VQGLLIIIFSLPKPSYFWQNHSIGWYFCQQDLIPFQRLFGISHHLLNVCHLI
jgi:hypothetical protein